MTARQLVNVVYAFCAEGLDADGLAGLHEALDPASSTVQERRRELVYALGGEIG